MPRLVLAVSWQSSNPIDFDQFEHIPLIAVAVLKIPLESSFQ
jgi:hypothetical protein